MRLVRQLATRVDGVQWARTICRMRRDGLEVRHTVRIGLPPEIQS